MFSCRNDYSVDDLKEVQCYVCKRLGHLCCVNTDDATQEKFLVTSVVSWVIRVWHVQGCGMKLQVEPHLVHASNVVKKDILPGSAQVLSRQGRGIANHQTQKIKDPKRK
ncbi:Cellular nucleic acid-binding protein like [Spatholobus suberectus]|nr:Cellular nucleic acid-binding protein like [Spatholobus suberectus]